MKRSGGVLGQNKGKEEKWLDQTEEMTADSLKPLG